MLFSLHEHQNYRGWSIKFVHWLASARVTQTVIPSWPICPPAPERARRLDNKPIAPEADVVGPVCAVRRPNWSGRWHDSAPGRRCFGPRWVGARSPNWAYYSRFGLFAAPRNDYILLAATALRQWSVEFSAGFVLTVVMSLLRWWCHVISIVCSWNT